MSEPHVLMGGEQRKKPAPALPTPSASDAWRWVGWFGLALLAAGLGDTILAFVPFRMGIIEWEFGTIAATFAGLPLVTMGFAATLGAANALGLRRAVLVLAWLVLVWGTLVSIALVIFLTDVPVALRAVSGEAQLGIKKAIVKTTMLGVIFSAVYFVGGIASLRRMQRLTSEP